MGRRYQYRLFFFGALLLGCPALGKNLDGRFGFGVSQRQFTGSAAVSAKYFHSSLISSKFLVGFNTQTSVYEFGIETTRNVVMEENLNIYLGVGGSIINGPNSAGTVATGLEFEALLGGEFFLSGLPNLGIYFETGINLKSLHGTHFSSLGGGFGGGGIHYYF